MSLIPDGGNAKEEYAIIEATTEEVRVRNLCDWGAGGSSRARPRLLASSLRLLTQTAALSPPLFLAFTQTMDIRLHAANDSLHAYTGELVQGLKRISGNEARFRSPADCVCASAEAATAMCC